MRNKPILYRLLGIGKVPNKYLDALKNENIFFMEEGITGSYITKNLKCPYKYQKFRKEGFIGSIILTKHRLICFTHSKKQINIALNDPKLKLLTFSCEDSSILIKFESSHFKPECTGKIILKYNINKCKNLMEQIINNSVLDD